MGAFNPPERNVTFTLRVPMRDYQNPGNFKTSPTIAAGDFKVSKDGGAFANCTNLPTVEPASTAWVEVILTATEMDADGVIVQWIDQTAPKEWADGGIYIPTA